MIGSLKGIVSATGEDRALIEVQGVGYLVHAGARTLSRMGTGAVVHIFVETQMREDSLKLFGFLLMLTKSSCKYFHLLCL